MRTRTKIIAGLAIGFLAVRLLASITTMHFPIDPTPPLHVAFWAILISLWAVLLFGVKVAWYPLAAYCAYGTIESVLGMFYLGSTGGLDVPNIVLMIVEISVAMVPLIALILDPPWKWEKKPNREIADAAS